MKLLLAIIFLSCTILPARADIVTGLVGWWKLDGNGLDSSGQGNHGVVHGSVVTADRFGNGSGAMDFDEAGDYVEIADSNSLNFSTNNFTLAVWVEKEATADVLLRKGGGYSTSYPGYSIAGGGNLQIGGTSKVIYSGSPGGILPNGAWAHLVYTIDRQGYIKKFINGVFQGQADISADANESINTSAVLLFSRIDMQPWIGKIDDVRIYNRVLTAADVLQLYNNGAATKLQNATLTNATLK